MSRTLSEIEAEAKRLCGTEFEVDLTAADSVVLIEFGNQAFAFAKFSTDGVQAVDIDEAFYGEDCRRLFSFITICQQLDHWIKGE